MKNLIIFFLFLAIIITGCAPTQSITSSWVNREALPKGPYKKVLVMVISDNKEANRTVEDMMAKKLTKKDRVAVKSSDIFPPNSSFTNESSREQIAEAISKNGCDGILTLALLDVKTTQVYQPGTAYYPMTYGYYGSYYGYHSYYYPQVYSPGYYTTEKSYYVESNFYDIATDALIWSVQSVAYNPTGLNDWFQNYSYMLINHLKKEGIIKN
jgi:hypothetical protein